MEHQGQRDCKDGHHDYRYDEMTGLGASRAARPERPLPDFNRHARLGICCFLASRLKESRPRRDSAGVTLPAAGHRDVEAAGHLVEFARTTPGRHCLPALFRWVNSNPPFALAKFWDGTFRECALQCWEEDFKDVAQPLL